MVLVEVSLKFPEAALEGLCISLNMKGLRNTGLLTSTNYRYRSIKWDNNMISSRLGRNINHAPLSPEMLGPAKATFGVARVCEGVP